ncbi:MAG: NAD(+) diphosphatase, partial [Caldilineaceae bacterium]|nr:NAD(+) diphosphatase [Caldilineaceae bacterium]
DAQVQAALAEYGSFRELRAVYADLDRFTGALMAYAKGMVYWHQRHKYCGDCGSRSLSAEGGFMRVCTNEACGAKHFPRTDPAIIVLIYAGDKCLLGRQPTWPPGRYSIIAGFVEPGESAEDAVKREAMEEAGVHVGRIEYQASQPWPFPSSLMLGYMAEAASTEVDLVDDELEAAYWFTRAQVADMVRKGDLKLPPDISISHRLIERWFDAGDEGKLADLVKGPAW